MLFGPMAFLYTVYQLECLRLTTHTNLVPMLFLYLEDRAIQKDKNGESVGQIVWAVDNVFIPN